MKTKGCSHITSHSGCEILDFILEIYDSSHEWAHVVKCKECGQFYLRSCSEKGWEDEYIITQYFPIEPFELPDEKFKDMAISHAKQLLGKASDASHYYNSNCNYND